MLRAHGLFGHFRNNDVRATALLAGFAAYIGLLWWAVCLAYSATGLELRVATAQLKSGHQLNTSHAAFALETAEHVAVAYAWIPAVLALGWLAYAWAQRRELVREATRAHGVAYSSEPKLYNMVETLAIGAGLPTPSIEIVESGALNAYSSGRRFPLWNAPLSAASGAPWSPRRRLLRTRTEPSRNRTRFAPWYRLHQRSASTSPRPKRKSAEGPARTRSR